MPSKHKTIRFTAAVLAMLLIIVVVILFRMNGYTKIDEWSSNLTAESIEWAQVAVGFGIEKRSYDLTPNEYDELLSSLKTVTDATSSREAPDNCTKNNYYLALRCDQKLWLFQCYDSGVTSLTFEDRDTSAYYGCEDSLLYIDSPILWNYILNTVNSKTVD